MDVMGALQNKLGPLEAWQWGALAGGGVLVFRLIHAQQQAQQPASVTLTPNAQPAIGGAAPETVGSILSDFGAQGYQPSDFQVTLPDGTAVHFTGTTVSTTPPASDGGSSGGSSGGGSSGGGSSGGGTTTIPPISSSGAAPMPRLGNTRPMTGVLNSPNPRTLGAIAGANPVPYPGYHPPLVSSPDVTRPPASVVIAPTTAPGGRGTTASGGTPATSPTR